MTKGRLIARGVAAAACLCATTTTAASVGAHADASSGPTIRYRSAAFPYSIAYPGGWMRRVVTSDGQKVEQFGLGPWGHDEVNVSVTLVASAGASAADDTALRQDLEAQRRKTYGNMSEVGSVQVAGHTIVMYAWNHKDNGAPLADTEVVFADHGHLWVVVMVSDQGARQRYWLPTYTAMLRSIRLRAA